MEDNEGENGAAGAAADAEGFTCVHFNTQYPAATGDIAKLIHSTTTSVELRGELHHTACRQYLSRLSSTPLVMA